MNKFSSNIDYLRQYVNGELTPTEMYEIERAMHDDEMLMDIIEGLHTEKNLKLSNPTVEIHKKINDRISPNKGTKIFTFKKFAIAASILAILGIGALYLVNPENDTVELMANSTSNKPNTTTSEEPIVTNEDPDSMRIAYVEIQENSTETQIPPTIANRVKIKTSTNENSPQKKIMVYSAKPKMKVVIEGPKFLNKEDNEEEVIIAKVGNSFNGQVQTELLSAKVGSAQQPKPSTSIAKTQADLQKLDLDPQTKANLSMVLSRQAMEMNNDIKEKQTESTISEILINGNVLANKNNPESRIITSSESFGAIGAKTIQNGNPTIGWTSFNDYIREQLKKKGFTAYHLNISFDLDANMKPIHIEIKTSSNPKINNLLIDILKKGSTWENKDPNHPIFIRINSEEATK